MSIQYHSTAELEAAVQAAADATTQTVIPTVVQTALDLKLTRTAQAAITANPVVPASFTVSSVSISDSAIQGMVVATGGGCYGFVNANEGDTLVAIIKSLHSRVVDLEARLVTMGLLTAS